MTSELSKYLNEQLGVFLNVKLAKNWFLSENFFVYHISSNTYSIEVIENFLRYPLNKIIW